MPARFIKYSEIHDSETEMTESIKASTRRECRRLCGSNNRREECPRFYCRSSLIRRTLHTYLLCNIGQNDRENRRETIYLRVMEVVNKQRGHNTRNSIFECQRNNGRFPDNANRRRKNGAR